MQNNNATRTYAVVEAPERGTGPGSAGQCGDTQGLSDVAEAGPLSVVELVQDGQYFEAEAIAGVEHALDAGVEEIHVKEVSEDDVPGEYQGSD